MKIIHCADLHLDSALKTHLSAEKARERNNEILNTFSEMIQYAVTNGVDTVLIAGDLFDRKTISAKTRNFVLSKITGNPGIRFYYLKGNHDADGFLDKLDELPENLYTFTDQWNTYTLAEGRKRITLSGVELTSENAGRVYHTLSLNPEDYNIVMLHGQNAEYKSRDKAETISLSEWKNRNIDYLALGHIHSYKRENLDYRGIYCYPGCLEGRGFDECGEHGFVLLEISEETFEMKHSFVPIAYRNTYEVNVDISGCVTSAEALDRVGSELKTDRYREKDLIKIVLCGQIPFDAEIDTDLIVKQYEQEYYYVKAVNKAGLVIDYNRYTNDRSLKGAFIRKVQGCEDLSEEDKAVIIRYGLQALSGEEIV